MLELDHIFVFTEPGAPEADLLLDGVPVPT